eukprot:922523-Prorocentrum_minimum.AAC.2
MAVRWSSEALLWICGLRTTTPPAGVPATCSAPTVAYYIRSHRQTLPYCATVRCWRPIAAAYYRTNNSRITSHRTASRRQSQYSTAAIRYYRDAQAPPPHDGSFTDDEAGAEKSDDDRTIVVASPLTSLQQITAERSPRPEFPLTAVVGNEQIKLALLLAAVGMYLPSLLATTLFHVET